MKTRKLLCVLVIGLAVALAGCGGGGGGSSDTTPVVDTTSKLVKAADGGSLSLPSLIAAVSIPAGALASDKTISISRADSLPADAGLVPDTACEFGPTDTTFSTSATITIRYDPTKLGTIREDTLRLVKLVSGAWVTVLGSHLDAADHLVMAPVPSFSTYAIVGDVTGEAVSVRLMSPGEVYNYHTTITAPSGFTETDEEFPVLTETGETPTYGVRRFLIGPDDWRFEQAANGTIYLLGERFEQVTSSTASPVFIPSPIEVGQTYTYTVVLHNTDLTKEYTATKHVTVNVTGTQVTSGVTYYIVDYNYTTTQVWVVGGTVEVVGTIHMKVNPLVGLFSTMDDSKDQDGTSVYMKTRLLTSTSF